MAGPFAIFGVTEDRRADRGAMSAELVRPAGDRHQREPARLCSDAIDDPVIGDRAPALLSIGTNAFAAPAYHLRERQVDTALSYLRPADDDRPIGLARRLLAESPRQKCRSGGGAGNHQDAARFLVEPVHEAGALGVSEAQAVEQAVDMPLGRRAALNREPRRLVEDDQCIVAV